MEAVINGIEGHCSEVWDLFSVICHLRPLESSPPLLQLFHVPSKGAQHSWAVPFLSLILDGTFGKQREQVRWEPERGESCPSRASPSIQDHPLIFGPTHISLDLLSSLMPAAKS